MKSIFALIGMLALAGCGSITSPAAVQMDSGEAFIGTTTAAASGGHFEVRSSRKGVRCSGNYDARDASETITVPVRCTDGRYGVVTVTRTPDLMAGSGRVSLADGSSGAVAFGRLAASVISTPKDSFNTLGAAASVSRQATLNSSGYPAVPSGGCQSENYYGGISCVTGSPRTTFVGGYFRKNGTYVRSYYRSRR
ncbi:hypothetical protein [Rhizobium dioscoreae]|uniref:hypothetical protein n=1 Tax=Rhizobium dioscoreae TaxID=2653122 RepID=UPI001260E783|nr:hypothetical protein [Rhizobium dioscoreae]